MWRTVKGYYPRSYLIWGIIFAGITIGVTALLLILDGRSPFAGTSQMSFMDMNKQIFRQMLPAETKDLMNRIESRKQNSADGSATGTSQQRGLKTNRGIFKYILFSIITCGIYSIWWDYKFANRLASNAGRYGLSFQENGTTVLLWRTIGLLLCGLGTWIALHIQIKNLNKLAAAYNQQYANSVEM